MKITVSAPGKLHLSGEHSVVYGKPAVLTSISSRIYVTVEKNPNPIRQLADQIPKSIKAITHKKNYLVSITKLVEKKFNCTFDDFIITVNSDIPEGVGLGSSAALAVATIGALSQILKQPWDARKINELAFEAEKQQHGNPSGGDNTVVTYGGMLWFRREFDFLKTFWLLPFKFPKSFAPFTLINTGRSEITGELVKFVKRINTDTREQVCLEIEKTTKDMMQAIHDEYEPEFRKALKENQRLLTQLGVVSPKTQKLITEIEKSGGVAKISGAGGIKSGSGVAIAMHMQPETIHRLAKTHGFPSFQVQLGGEGVRREQVVM